MTFTTTAIEAITEQMTAKGRETMEAIGKGQLSFFDEGVVEHSGIWGECLVSEMGHKSSGVINRLRSLGLLESSPAGEDDDSDWWALTALGAAVAQHLGHGLEYPADHVEAPATTVTVKFGRKWTYVYDVDGSLIAEVRNDAFATVGAALGIRA